MGPLINARQRDRVLEYIDMGKREGARILGWRYAKTSGQRILH